jgi:hypothetical protein
MRSRSVPFGSLASALLLVLAAGCDDEGSMGDASELIACEPGQLLIEGTIDGNPVRLTQSTAGSGFTQFGEGEFSVAELFEPDPTRTFLTMNWTPTLPDGASTSQVTATLVIPAKPATAAFAGTTFCSGAGSRVRMPRESENVADLQFSLATLTSGAGCAEPHTGTLRGCWRSGSD